MDDIYRHLNAADFDKDNFLSDNRALLEELPLTRKEFRLLREEYMKRGLGTARCQLCQKHVDSGEDVFMLPRCQHTFERTCLITHLLKSIDCPVCNRNIRIEMIQDLYDFKQSSSFSVDPARPRVCSVLVHHHRRTEDLEDVRSSISDKKGRLPSKKGPYDDY